MDAQIIKDAETYRRVRERAKNYYAKNIDAISEKRKAKYHELHPDAGVRPNRKHGLQILSVGIVNASPDPSSSV
jgi:hypothetical protein